MLQLILILLAVAALASVVGLGRVSGATLLAAKILIVIALLAFLLLGIGIISVA